MIINTRKISIAFLIIYFFLTSILIGCKKCTNYECDNTDPNIVGAYCNDGTTSESTGSGTCSSHGGVRVWRCRSCE